MGLRFFVPGTDLGRGGWIVFTTWTAIASGPQETMFSGHGSDEDDEESSVEGGRLSLSNESA